MFRRRRAIQIGAAAVIALALGAGSLRAAEDHPIAINADELADFTIDDADLFPRPGSEDQFDVGPVARMIPPEPAETADPVLNLVPLPAPVVPAILGISFVAVRLALRGRKNAAAGVFRRRR